MGDGGFTFNRVTDRVNICGYRPYKKPQLQNLSKEQKSYNKYLGQMRVMVENTINRVNRWKILKGVLHHWRNGKGQLNINDILPIAVVLSNRDIKEHPLRQGN